jgi:hypothetical protein
LARKRTHLRTIGHIITELGRVYRQADGGQIPWSDAASASRILREVRQALEGGDLERRLDAVNADLASVRQMLADAGSLSARPNGHHHDSASPQA